MRAVVQTSAEFRVVYNANQPFLSIASKVTRRFHDVLGLAAAVRFAPYRQGGTCSRQTTVKTGMRK